ncbi:hypothetical protein EDB19DRAFT_1829470 [Suillus lakei]|nr:hypothetical protein EDB19DRAFT_1829470 [Suillus lakei]
MKKRKPRRAGIYTFGSDSLRRCPTSYYARHGHDEDSDADTYSRARQCQLPVSRKFTDDWRLTLAIGTVVRKISEMGPVGENISAIDTLLRLEGEQEDAESSTRYTRRLISGFLSRGTTHINEADRLMNELVFEDVVKGIIQGLDGKRELVFQAVQDATIREGVQKLAGTALIRPLVIKDLDKEKAEGLLTSKLDNESATTASTKKSTSPSQISQKLVIIPFKMRLVAQTQGQRGDSSMEGNKVERVESDGDESDNEHNKADESAEEEKVLGLPLVRAVIQYDLPIEGGATEYLYRVGRTAHAGKGGEAWSIVAPSESEWVKRVEGELRGSMTADHPDSDKRASIESVLANGFGGKGSEYEERATETRLSFERGKTSLGSEEVKRTLRLASSLQNTELARRAFTPHTKAYATHPSNERHSLHVRYLHIGHLAKAFTLREAPKTIMGRGSRPARYTKQHDVGDTE